MTKHFNLKLAQNQTKLTFSRTVRLKQPIPMPKVLLHSVFYLGILSHPSFFTQKFSSIYNKISKMAISWNNLSPPFLSAAVNKP